MEGRILGNHQPEKGYVMETAEVLYTTKTKLDRIAWLSNKDSTKEFECLMHLFNVESLTQCFYELDSNKAIGIDGIDKATYRKGLEENIRELIERMKRMGYRPGPVRQVLIPKEGKPGATRPLGISNFEDKIVQRMMQKVLESIYEPIFLGCSYGFRPGKGCHDAIKDLQNHLYSKPIQTVIDIDLKNFFGTIDHQLLENLLRKKIKDPRLMRYIIRMFKAGVLAEGDLRVSDEGVPQGSICSPILANIFAHYAIDTWIRDLVQPHCKGEVRLFRYADDAVICCQYNEDALRIEKVLGKRLEKFKLQLNEDKTKSVPFDRRQAEKGVEQGTFDFLGFTFYIAKSRNGRMIPKIRTRTKTIRTKLKRVEEWIKSVRNGKAMKELWKIFTAKLRGHGNYYGVSHNIQAVYAFYHKATRSIFRWLNRRSQRRSFTWEEFSLFMKRYPLPRVKIEHKLF